MGSISIWHWLIVALIVSLVFGTKKLRTVGGDLGTAIRSFKDAVNTETSTGPRSAEISSTEDSKADAVDAAYAAGIASLHPQEGR